MGEGDAHRTPDISISSWEAFLNRSPPTVLLLLLSGIGREISGRLGVSVWGLGNYIPPSISPPPPQKKEESAREGRPMYN